MKHLCRTLIILVLLSSLHCEIADTGYREMPPDPPPKHIIMAEVTAYTASVQECGKDDGITASGVPAAEGQVAMDESIPFGTRVLIEKRRYVVTDRGGDIHGNRIDVYMDDENNAWEYGRKFIEVEILDKE